MFIRPSFRDKKKESGSVIHCAGVGGRQYPVLEIRHARRPFQKLPAHSGTDGFIPCTAKEGQDDIPEYSIFGCIFCKHLASKRRFIRFFPCNACRFGSSFCPKEHGIVSEFSRHELRRCEFRIPELCPFIMIGIYSFWLEGCTFRAACQDYIALPCRNPACGHIDGGKTGSALEIKRKSRHPFRETAFQKKQSSDISSGSHCIPANAKVRHDAVPSAKLGGYTTAQHFGPY